MTPKVTMKQPDVAANPVKYPQLAGNRGRKFDAEPGDLRGEGSVSSDNSHA